ncbi:MAG: TatD family hydrolase [Candidatus Bathyarchaeia archaeon]|jgi:TatD DNase family protein
MKLVDAHVHLSDAQYAGHIEELVADAKNASVTALITNAMDLKTCKSDLALAEKYSGLVYPALGIHPWNVNALAEGELKQTIDLIEKSKGEVKAIGEIGLDFKYETAWEKQMMVFDKMLHLAEKLDLPVIIHSRGTTDKVIDLLPSYRVKRVLLHWFSYPLSALDRAMDRGYFITEGPPAVYSSGIREVIEKVTLTQFLTETDGPVTYYKRPFKGQLTKPSFIRNVVEAVAEIKKTNVDDVAQRIAENFQVFFNVKLN